MIGKIPGIRRPAFAPFIPTNKGGFILCDAGANADTKPQHLVQFALMAGAYMEHLENRLNPRVALLNIGQEENKGNELTINAYPMLKNHISTSLIRWLTASIRAFYQNRAIIRNLKAANHPKECGFTAT